jgi:hypothetical protein
MTAARPGPLRVVIKHEPFLPWFELCYDGKTEELDHQQALDWFAAHGAKDLEKVNGLINHAFNFHQAICTIAEPVTPPGPRGPEARYAPKI